MKIKNNRLLSLFIVFVFAITAGAGAFFFLDGRVRGDAAGPSENIPNPTINLSTNGTVTAFIDRSGDMWIWGDNSLGMLGNGTMSDEIQTTPIQVNHPNNREWRQVEVLQHTVVALDQDGRLWSWGDVDFWWGSHDFWDTVVSFFYAVYIFPQMVNDGVICLVDNTNPGLCWMITSESCADCAAWAIGNAQLINEARESGIESAMIGGINWITTPTQIVDQSIDGVVFAQMNSAFGYISVIDAGGEFWMFGGNTGGANVPVDLFAPIGIFDDFNHNVWGANDPLNPAQGAQVRHLTSVPVPMFDVADSTVVFHMPGLIVQENGDIFRWGETIVPGYAPGERYTVPLWPSGISVTGDPIHVLTNNDNDRIVISGVEIAGAPAGATWHVIQGGVRVDTESIFMFPHDIGIRGISHSSPPSEMRDHIAVFVGEDGQSLFFLEYVRASGLWASTTMSPFNLGGANPEAFENTNIVAMWGTGTGTFYAETECGALVSWNENSTDTSMIGNGEMTGWVFSYDPHILSSGVSQSPHSVAIPHSSVTTNFRNFGPSSTTVVNGGSYVFLTRVNAGINTHPEFSLNTPNGTLMGPAQILIEDGTITYIVGGINVGDTVHFENGYNYVANMRVPNGTYFVFGVFDVTGTILQSDFSVRDYTLAGPTGLPTGASFGWDDASMALFGETNRDFEITLPSSHRWVNTTNIANNVGIAGHTVEFVSSHSNTYLFRITSPITSNINAVDWTVSIESNMVNVQLPTQFVDAANSNAVVGTVITSPANFDSVIGDHFSFRVEIADAYRQSFSSIGMTLNGTALEVLSRDNTTHIIEFRVASVESAITADMFELTGWVRNTYLVQSPSIMNTWRQINSVNAWRVTTNAEVITHGDTFDFTVELSEAFSTSTPVFTLTGAVAGFGTVQPGVRRTVSGVVFYDFEVTNITGPIVHANYSVTGLNIRTLNVATPNPVTGQERGNFNVHSASAANVNWDGSYTFIIEFIGANPDVFNIELIPAFAAGFVHADATISHTFRSVENNFLVTVSNVRSQVVAGNFLVTRQFNAIHIVEVPENDNAGRFTVSGPYSITGTNVFGALIPNDIAIGKPMVGEGADFGFRVTLMESHSNIWHTFNVFLENDLLTPTNMFFYFNMGDGNFVRWAGSQAALWGTMLQEETLGGTDTIWTLQPGSGAVAFRVMFQYVVHNVTGDVLYTDYFIDFQVPDRWFVNAPNVSGIFTGSVSRSYVLHQGETATNVAFTVRLADMYSRSALVITHPNINNGLPLTLDFQQGALRSFIVPISHITGHVFTAGFNISGYEINRWATASPSNMPGVRVSAPSVPMVEHYVHQQNVLPTYFTFVVTVQASHFGRPIVWYSNQNATITWMSEELVTGGAVEHTFRVTNVNEHMNAARFTIDGVLPRTFDVIRPMEGIGFTVGGPAQSRVEHGGAYQFTINLMQGFDGANPSVEVWRDGEFTNRGVVVNREGSHVTVTINNVTQNLYTGQIRINVVPRIFTVATPNAGEGFDVFGPSVTNITATHNNTHTFTFSINVHEGFPSRPMIMLDSTKGTITNIVFNNITGRYVFTVLPRDNITAADFTVETVQLVRHRVQTGTNPTGTAFSWLWALNVDVLHGGSAVFRIQLHEGVSVPPRIWVANNNATISAPVSIGGGMFEYTISNVIGEISQGDWRYDPVSVRSYTVSVPTNQFGRVVFNAPGLRTVNENGSFVFTATVNDAYSHSGVTITLANGVLATMTYERDGNVFTFTVSDIFSNVSFEVGGFVRNTYNVEGPVGPGQFITTGETASPVTHGGSFSFTIEIDESVRGSSVSISWGTVARGTIVAPVDRTATVQTWTINNITGSFTREDFAISGFVVNMWNVVAPNVTGPFSITYVSSGTVRHGENFDFVITSSDSNISPLVELLADSAREVIFVSELGSSEYLFRVLGVRGSVTTAHFDVRQLTATERRAAAPMQRDGQFQVSLSANFVTLGGSYTFDIILHPSVTQADITVILDGPADLVFVGRNNGVVTFRVEDVQGDILQRMFEVTPGMLPVNRYTVNFDTGPGGSVVPEIRDILHGRNISAPTIRPTRDGFTFSGYWYLDPAGTQRFHFDRVIDRNITLFAGWTPEAYRVVMVANVGGMTRSFTATHGSLIDVDLIFANLSRPNYVSGGWINASNGKQWNFATDTVTGILELQKRWIVCTEDLEKEIALAIIQRNFANQDNNREFFVIDTITDLTGVINLANQMVSDAQDGLNITFDNVFMQIRDLRIAVAGLTLSDWQLLRQIARAEALNRYVYTVDSFDIVYEALVDARWYVIAGEYTLEELRSLRNALRSAIDNLVVNEFCMSIMIHMVDILRGNSDYYDLSQIDVYYVLNKFLDFMRGTPTQTGYDTLIQQYAPLFRINLAYFAAQLTLNLGPHQAFLNGTGRNYTPASWNRYIAAINAMEEFLSANARISDFIIMDSRVIDAKLEEAQRLLRNLVSARSALQVAPVQEDGDWLDQLANNAFLVAVAVFGIILFLGILMMLIAGKNRKKDQSAA